MCCVCRIDVRLRIGNSFDGMIDNLCVVLCIEQVLGIDVLHGCKGTMNITTSFFCVVLDVVCTD